MNLRDKIGLWADLKISEMYFDRVPFQHLRERTLEFLIPICNHKDFETGEECKERGEPCWLPDYEERNNDQVEWYCYKHMHSAGYCRGCHELWAGCEDFDFDPRGLCSNCRHDPEFTGDDEDEFPF